jgi:hypothetical protein
VAGVAEEGEEDVAENHNETSSQVATVVGDHSAKEVRQDMKGDNSAGRIINDKHSK